MSQQVALITGAAKRLGANTAARLHQLGYTVVIHCNHSIEQANMLALRLNETRVNSAFVVQADLSDISKINALSEYISTEFSRLDVLINNASSFYATPLADLTTAQYHDLIATNMTAPLFLTKACMELLKAANGVVINMCDIHATRPL